MSTLKFLCGEAVRFSRRKRFARVTRTEELMHAHRSISAAGFRPNRRSVGSVGNVIGGRGASGARCRQFSAHFSFSHTPTVTMVRVAPRARHSRYPLSRRVNGSARSRRDRKASRTRRRRSTLFVDRDRPRTPHASRGPVFPPRLADLHRCLRLCHTTRERLNNRTGSYLRIRRPRGRAPRHGQPPAGHLRGCPPGVPR